MSIVLFLFKVGLSDDSQYLPCDMTCPRAATYCVYKCDEIVFFILGLFNGSIAKLANTRSASDIIRRDSIDNGLLPRRDDGDEIIQVQSERGEVEEEGEEEELLLVDVEVDVEAEVVAVAAVGSAAEGHIMVCTSETCTDEHVLNGSCHTIEYLPVLIIDIFLFSPNPQQSHHRGSEKNRC